MIYMKIDGVTGPITYENTKGWIALRGAETRGPIPTPGKESRGGSQIVMKEPDEYSRRLVQLKARAAIVDITIVQFDERKPQDVWRMTLRDALMGSYRLGPDLDTFTFAVSEINEIPPPRTGPYYGSRTGRPQDWASIQAAKVFSQSAQA